jgi:hypothetical protein
MAFGRRFSPNCWLVISPPYAVKSEKNSLFYFLQPCYPINSREAVYPVISSKKSQISQKLSVAVFLLR